MQIVMFKNNFFTYVFLILLIILILQIYGELHDNLLHLYSMLWSNQGS